MFQRAILMSIISLKALHADMHERFGISFLMTAKVNQDAVENLFSMLRVRGGGNDHPTPLNVLRRMRVIILGKPIASISKGQNTVDRLNEQYSVTALIRSLKNGTHKQHKDSNDAAQCEDPCEAITESGEFIEGFSDMHSLITEEDGFEYLAGAICRKYQHEFTYLGSYTHKLEYADSLLDHDYAFPASYVEHLSLGGLTKPSQMWLDQAQRLEKHFKTYHGNQISKQPRVNQHLSSILHNKYPEIPYKIVQHFIRQRTYIRISTLNRILKAEKSQKNCVKRLSKPISKPLTKEKKKMRKILL